MAGKFAGLKSANADELLWEAEEAAQAGDHARAEWLEAQVMAAQAADLQSLKAALERLPKKAAQTAEMGWTDIAREAQEYARAMAEPPKRNPPPSKVEADLKALAACARTLRHKLTTLPRPALDAIENSAYSRIGKAADPWPWFPIGRYSFDSDGVPTQEEPYLGNDCMRPDELEILAAFLDDVAGYAATRKAEPRGKRTPTQAQLAKDRAKRSLVSTCHFELHIALDRAVGHALLIAQTVHTWATGEAVGKDWGQSVIDQEKAWAEANAF